MDHLFNPGELASADQPVGTEPVSSGPVETAELESSISQVQPEADLPELPVVPDIYPPVFDYCNNISYFCYSLRGASHEKNGAPCQDRCYSRYIKAGKYLVIAIADGVGSCVLSDLGAHVAVHTSVDFLAENLSRLPKRDFTVERIGQLLRKMMKVTYEAVEQTAEDAQQLLFSLQSTLTVAVYDGKDLYFAHAGDDGIVALNTDGCLQLATVRHKGEEASSVYPLQSVSTWQFGMFKNTAAFVMATDGVLDSFVSTEYENNRIYYPFIQRAFSKKITSAMDTKDICYEMFTQMQEPKFRSAVTDDLTIAVVTNQKKVHTCLPHFDQQQWDAETKRYQEARYQALYGKEPTPTSDDEASTEEQPELPETVSAPETEAAQTTQIQCADPGIAEMQTQQDPGDSSGNSPEAAVPATVPAAAPGLRDGKQKQRPFRDRKKRRRNRKELAENEEKEITEDHSTSAGNEMSKVSREDWRKRLVDMLIYILNICAKAMIVLAVFAILCLLYLFFILPNVIRHVLDAVSILAALL